MLSGIEELGGIENNRADPTLINSNLIDLVANVNILLAAYSKIRSTPRNSPPGVDSETLDGLDSNTGS